MKNFITNGETLAVVAPVGGYAGGDFVQAGALNGVVVATVLEGETAILARHGVFELPKATGAAWVQGDRLFWDSVAKKFTKDATKTPVHAVAFEAAATNDAVGRVALAAPDGGFRVASGEHVTVDADDTVVTGLAEVHAVVATLADDPVAGCQHVTASKGDQAGAPAAGSVLLKTWKATAAGDTALIAATTFGKKVNWIAIGK